MGTDTAQVEVAIGEYPKNKAGKVIETEAAEAADDTVADEIPEAEEVADETVAAKAADETVAAETEADVEPDAESQAAGESAGDIPESIDEASEEASNDADVELLDTEDHVLATAIAETAEVFKEIDEALASDSAEESAVSDNKNGESGENDASDENERADET